jgi:heparin/heparan-sulfate lyase
MLRPKAEDRDVEILSGEAVHTVFGQRFTPPAPSKPEANGHRVLFSPKTAQASDVFLTVMPMSAEKALELPVNLTETPATFALTLADRIVVLSKTGGLIDRPFPVNVPAGRDYQVLLAGLAPGNWSIRGKDGKLRLNARIEAGKNTALVTAAGGDFTASPGR